MEGRVLLPQVKGLVEMEIFVRSRRRWPWANFLYLTIILGFFLVSPSGKAQEDDDDLGKMARCSWDAPTYGTPVHHYILQVVTLGSADIETTTVNNIMNEYHDVYVEFGLTYKARVAGVDDQNRQGPWSLWTPIYGPRETHEE